MIISPDDRRFIVTALRIARDAYNADAKVLQKHDGASIKALGNEAVQKAQRADELADRIEHDTDSAEE